MMAYLGTDWTKCKGYTRFEHPSCPKDFIGSLSLLACFEGASLVITKDLSTVPWCLSLFLGFHLPFVWRNFMRWQLRQVSPPCAAVLLCAVTLASHGARIRRIPNVPSWQEHSAAALVIQVQILAQTQFIFLSWWQPFWYHSCRWTTMSTFFF